MSDDILREINRVYGPGGVREQDARFAAWLAGLPLWRLMLLRLATWGLR